MSEVDELKLTQLLALEEAVASLRSLPEWELVKRATVYARVRKAMEHVERIHALCKQPESDALTLAQPAHPRS